MYELTKGYHITNFTIGRGPAQYSHFFYAASNLIAPQSCKLIFSTNFQKNYIETSNDTIKFFNFVVGQTDLQI